VSFNRPFMIGACFLALVCHARGATITSSGSDVFNATTTYTIHINNGGNEQNPAFGTNPVTNTGDSFVMGSYSSAVPDTPGSLVSALLTLSWSAAPVSVTGAGTATYTPTFAATTHSATFVTITAGAATATINLSPAVSTTINLLNYAGFDAALRADSPITVAWQSSSLFARTVGEKRTKDTVKNVTLDYNLASAITATAGLVIDYNNQPPPSSVPEPATYALIGLGLIGCRFLPRTFRR
jgi:hypothetical protein